jgi:hypothetical protein
MSGNRDIIGQDVGKDKPDPTRLKEPVAPRNGSGASDNASCGGVQAEKGEL